MCVRDRKIAGVEEWVKEYCGDGTRLSLLLGRRVAVNREVMDGVDRYIIRERVR